MAVPKKVLNHLDNNKMKYEILEHKIVFTAFDLAQTMKRKLSEIAKTVLVKADKEYYLVVVPANCLLDFSGIKKALKVKKVSMARENEMKTKFKVKPGAITPFGSVHKVAVLIDSALIRAKVVVFGAGSFTESIMMKPKDFIDLEQAQKAVIGKRDKSKKDPKPKVVKKKRKAGKKKRAVRAKKKTIKKKRKSSLYSQ